jgi:hypothetical protein
MRRVLVGVCVGAVCGVLALAGFGAWGGYTHGHEWVAAPAPLPEEDAVRWAFVFVAYAWWLAGGVGGVIGGLAGLGSWLVRPRPPVNTRASDHGTR